MTTFKSIKTGIEEIVVDSGYIEITYMKDTGLRDAGNVFLIPLVTIKKIEFDQKDFIGDCKGLPKFVSHSISIVSDVPGTHIKFMIDKDIAKQVYNEIKCKKFKTSENDEITILKRKLENLSRETEMHTAMIASLTERNTETPSGDLLSM